MEGILGKKIGMTHVYRGDVQIPVTVVEAGPLTVVQRKLTERDGYEAVQLGFGAKKPSRVTKPLTGHFKKHGSDPVYHLKEFALSEGDELKAGDKINCADVLKVGDFIDVTSTSKGKGFTGVIKRWNHNSGPEGHGSRHNRAPGSIGQSSNPSKVFKGMKMPGQYGNKTATIQNLEVVDIKAEQNLLIIKGSVPGARNSILVINKAVKKR